MQFSTKRLRQTFINEPDDMKWLRETHWKQLDVEYKSAIIYGNEDSPEIIEAYKSADPSIWDEKLVWRLVKASESE